MWLVGLGGRGGGVGILSAKHLAMADPGAGRGEGGSLQAWGAAVPRGAFLGTGMMGFGGMEADASV